MKFLLLLILVSCQGVPPQHLGVKNNQFQPCPDKPNCVSSFPKQGEKSYIEPIKIISNVERAKEKITKILQKNKSVTIRKIENNYIWAEYESAIFRFVDDMEFLISEKDALIHLKSASRKGYSDLGKNKEHIEEIRFKFYQNDF